ncbi:hypothetical protein GP486_004600 [Trichoglossum hirsutum]|uniref:Uncharacterized protein n=1 Tax=Trichoglossum hirsutum TaxID=265104 RepID=A0A9P8LB29_9PEZI|nr:hypothetical protein GP486_004600 [Trichoglossum hirsutum]
MDSFNGGFLDSQELLSLWDPFHPAVSSGDLQHVADGGIAGMLPPAIESFEAPPANTPAPFSEAPGSLGRSAAVMHIGPDFTTTIDAYRQEVVDSFDDFFLAGNPAENPMRYLQQRFPEPLSSENTHANSPISASDASPKIAFLPNVQKETEVQGSRPKPSGKRRETLAKRSGTWHRDYLYAHVRRFEILKFSGEIRDAKPEAKSIWKPITELPTGRNAKFKMVELSQGHSQENLRLHVREYTPEPGDKQYYKWYDGDVERFYNTPAYAIAELSYARKAIKKYLENNLKVYLNVILQRASPITKYTFNTALRNQDLTLLEPALKLWAASRFIEKPWHIAGSETLGMSKDSQVNSPYHDRIPQTPIMDFQLDNLVIHSILQPLLKEILNTLRSKTLSNRKEDWFELQLTQFILLNTIELTMAHDIEFARLHNIKNGANTLLTYFHNANNGHYPFSAPWPDVERSCQWTDDQKLYVTEIRRMLLLDRNNQLEVATQPGKEMFWTGQLHRADWSPVSVV